MKQLLKKISFVVLASAVMAPMTLVAQKEKEENDKPEAEQIIITRKNGKDDKVVIELNGDKVTVNGKPVGDSKEGEITVHRNKIKDIHSFSFDRNVFNYGNGIAGSWNDNFGMTTVDENRAMLGVTTEKDAKGAEIQTISKESAAEKAGLKKGDIITKINDDKIEGPDDLSTSIRKHKPGEKINIVYLRAGKEQKTAVELGKWKGVKNNYRMTMPDMNFESLPRIQSIPRIQGQNWNWSGGSPKLGLFIQDSEDGKGVKVIDVDEDGNAGKAGIKEDDVILDIDGKEVADATECAKIIKESKDKISVKMKILRKGKSETIDVKIPRKLKTADL